MRAKKGYFTKKGGSAFGKKKRRWFVLGEETLTYFEDESEVRNTCCIHNRNFNLTRA